MKYIRTTKGIYEYVYGDFNLEREYFNNEIVIKFADTIKELCDVLVYVMPKFII